MPDNKDFFDDKSFEAQAEEKKEEIKKRKNINLEKEIKDKIIIKEKEKRGVAKEKIIKRKDDSKSNKYLEIFKEGIITKNPIFVQLLGMCSVLAVSTTVVNGLGMGISVTIVLIFSNVLISLLRNFIPSKIRIASYIVIIAGLVTIVDMILKAYIPSLSNSLGLFIPLIVVNCIILARAESFASKNNVLSSLFDGLACGIGYTFAIVIVSVIREILGNGTIFGFQILGNSYSPALLLVLPAGGFLVLGLVIAVFQWLLSLKSKKETKNNNSTQL